MDSFETVDEALFVCKELERGLSVGEFPLVKWASVEPRLLAAFRKEECSRSLIECNLSAPLESVLGLQWNCQCDTLCFPITNRDAEVISKRQLLGVLARLFDPLGLIAPVIVEAKLLMREATLSGRSWDDPVEESVLRRFGRCYNDLVSLKALTIPRWLGFSSKLVKAQLRVFADASEKAFGAASYVRLCFDNGKVTSSLVLAKSRIAPRRSLTIPRLELQAAVLAVRLAAVAASSLHVEQNEIFYWTDSLTVIRWLNMEGCRLRAFVAHRVAEI
ncbi:Pao retrotransposon peptidase [Trichuris suis]|nr:Pao retrotransposon peptidase [Trichuris suis]